MSAQTWTHFPSPDFSNTIVGADSLNVYVKGDKAILVFNMLTNAVTRLDYPLNLPNCANVQCVKRTVSGDIWLGTYEFGIWRYAHGQWQNYNTTNSGISRDYVFSINDLQNGEIYVNHYYSLSRFDGANWSIIDSSNSPYSGKYINAIATGSKAVAIKEDWQKISVFDGQDWSVIDSNFLIGIGQRYNLGEMAVDSNNVLWVFIGDTLGMMNVLKYTSPNVYSVSPYSTVFCGNYDWGSEGFLGCKFSNRLMLISGQTKTIQLRDSSSCLNSNVGIPVNAFSVAEDPYRNIWFLNDSSLFRYENNTQTLSSAIHLDSLKGPDFDMKNSYFSSMRDGSNHLWFGTWGGFNTVALEFDGSRFIEHHLGGYFNNNTNDFKAVLAMTSNKSTGERYFGLPNAKLLKYTGTNWKVDTIISGNHFGDYPSISALAMDRNQTIVSGFIRYASAGVRPEPEPGIAIKNGLSWTVESLTNAGCNTNAVYTIAVDTFKGKNDYWIGTIGGGIMVRTGTNTYTRFTTSNSPIPNDTIQHIAIDHLGRKWIGTFNGLAIFNDTSWIVYSGLNNPFPGNDIEYIAFNTFDNNRPWVAVDGGICKWQDTTWVCYTACATPLHFGDVESIVFDQYGNTWLPSEGVGDGIASIDRISNIQFASVARVSGNVTSSSGGSLSNHLIELYQKTPTDLLLLSRTYTDGNGNYTFLTNAQDVYVKSTFLNDSNIAVYQGNTIVRQNASNIVFNGGKAEVNLKHAVMVKPSGYCSISGSIANAEVLKYPTQIYLLSAKDHCVVAGYTFQSFSSSFYFYNIPFGTYTIAMDRFGIIDSLFTPISVSVGHPALLNLVYFVNYNHLELIDGDNWPSGIVDQGLTDAEVKIYPIPTSQNLTIEWTSQDAQKAEVKVYDVLGNGMKAESFLLNVGANSRSLSLSDLSDGFYCLSLISGEKELKRKIMVKH